jgi:hypothetical protein
MSTEQSTEQDWSSRTSGWDAATVTAGATPRYVTGQDAELRDARTGLVVGPWSDAVKRAGALRAARR